jgi:hypothetical protein
MAKTMERRNFLKNTALTAASLAFLGKKPSLQRWLTQITSLSPSAINLI